MDTMTICGYCGRHMDGPVAAGRVRWGNCCYDEVTAVDKPRLSIVREIPRLLGSWLLRLVVIGAGMALMIPILITLWELLSS